MKIYISGPITNGMQKDTYSDDDVTSAIDVAIELIRMGHNPFTPQLTVFYAERISQRDGISWAKASNSIAPYAKWIANDLLWIDVCDAVFRMPGNSRGANMEVAYAETRNKPIFHSLEEVPCHT